MLDKSDPFYLSFMENCETVYNTEPHGSWKTDISSALKPLVLFIYEREPPVYAEDEPTSISRLRAAKKEYLSELKSVSSNPLSTIERTMRTK